MPVGTDWDTGHEGNPLGHPDRWGLPSTTDPHSGQINPAQQAGSPPSSTVCRPPLRSPSSSRRSGVRLWPDSLSVVRKVIEKRTDPSGSTWWGNLGRYRLGGLSLHHEREIRIAHHHEPQPPLVDPDLSPGPIGQPVGVEEAGGDRLLVPDRAGPDLVEFLRQLGAVTGLALQQCSDPGSTLVGVHDPRSESERRLVTDVLVVPTRQFGDPVALLVEVEPRDRSLHRSRVVARAAGSISDSAPTDRLGRQTGATDSSGRSSKRT